MRKVILDASGAVSNVIEWDGTTAWTLPDGSSLGPDGGEIGQKWNGSGYVWIVPPPEYEP